MCRYSLFWLNTDLFIMSIYMQTQCRLIHIGGSHWGWNIWSFRQDQVVWYFHENTWFSIRHTFLVSNYHKKTQTCLILLCHYSLWVYYEQNVLSMLITILDEGPMPHRVFHACDPSSWMKTLSQKLIQLLFLEHLQYRHWGWATAR